MCYPNNYFYYTQRINLIAKYTNDFKYFFVWGGGPFWEFCTMIWFAT